MIDSSRSKNSRRESDQSENSRKAYVNDLYGKDSTSIWQKARDQQEPWAMLRNQQEDTKARSSARKQRLVKLCSSSKIATILMISNQRDLIEEQQQLLTEMAITNIGNPKLALEALNQEKYSLLIIDYQLPMANGIQFLNSIKNIPGIANIPAVLLSEEELEKQTKNAAIKHGVKLFLVAPFEASVLAACVRRIIETNHD